MLISQGENTTGARLIGVEPEREAATTTIFSRIDQGQGLGSEAANELVLSHAMAQILGVGIGSEVILMTQAADGSMANDIFTIAGILSEASDGMEERNVYLHRDTASEFLVLGNRVHEVALALHHHEDAEAVAAMIQKELPELDVSPWQVIEAEF